MRLPDERVREIATTYLAAVPICLKSPDGENVDLTEEEVESLAAEVLELRKAMAWLEEHTVCIGTCDGQPEVDREAWWLVMRVTDDPPDFAAALRQAMAASPTGTPGGEG